MLLASRTSRSTSASSAAASEDDRADRRSRKPFSRNSDSSAGVIGSTRGTLVKDHLAELFARDSIEVAKAFAEQALKLVWLRRAGFVLDQYGRISDVTELVAKQRIEHLRHAP